VSERVFERANDRHVSERVFERANDRHVSERANDRYGAFFVAGCAATGHWCLVDVATLDRRRDSAVHQ